MLLVVVGVAMAQSASDLSLSMRYSGIDRFSLGFFLPPPSSSGGSITRTRAQRLTIDITNRGPATVDDVFVELRVEDRLSPILRATAVVCAHDRETPPLSGLRLQIGTMRVGDKRSCVVEFRATDAAPLIFSGFIVATVRALANSDPVPSNDWRAIEALGALDDYIRDMDLSIRSPTGVLAPGASHLFDVTLTNRGPGPEGVRPGEIAYSQRYEAGLRAVDRFGFSETGDPDCRYRVTDLGGDTFSRVSELVFEALPPGTSRTCTMRVHVLSGASGVRTLEFYNWAEDNGVYDENLANNRARLVLQFPAIAVDAGTRPGWMAMAMALFVLAAMAIRARMR